MMTKQPPRRGRPRVTRGDSSIVSVRIWAGHHDALIRKATEKRVELATYVRSILSREAERG